jgi:hypothetical protein
MNKLYILSLALLVSVGMLNATNKKHSRKNKLDAEDNLGSAMDESKPEENSKELPKVASPLPQVSPNDDNEDIGGFCTIL